MADAPTPDPSPHSRACGWRAHPHGPECSTNCPTCHGGPMPDPSPDTPNAYAPRCGHHGSPLVWLDPALRWRCPHCFPELFPAARPAAGSFPPDVTALADELRNAILDIDAHATPFGTDDDGFVSGGYLISVGSLHRALGVVGHSAAKCGGCRNCWTLDQWKAEEQLLRDELEAQAARITELEQFLIRLHEPDASYG